MSIKKALLYGFAIATTLLLATLLIGHLWVFMIIVVTAFISIAVITYHEKTQVDRKFFDDEKG